MLTMLTECFRRVQVFEQRDSWNRKKWTVALFRGFIKTNGQNKNSPKKGARNFQNSLPFERSACFYVKTSGNYEKVSKKRKPF